MNARAPNSSTSSDKPTLNNRVYWTLGKSAIGIFSSSEVHARRHGLINAMEEEERAEQSVKADTQPKVDRK